MSSRETPGKPVARRRRAEHHTVTFWHAEAVICTDGAPGGGWFEEAVRCTHNHISPAAADGCADALASAVDRGRRPSWIVSIYERRPERFR